MTPLTGHLTGVGFWTDGIPTQSVGTGFCLSMRNVFRIRTPCGRVSARPYVKNTHVKAGAGPFFIPTVCIPHI